MFLPSPSAEYLITENLDLYNSPSCQELATQAATGRQCRIEEVRETVLKLQLCEDGYFAWLPAAKAKGLQITQQSYQPLHLSAEQIRARLPQVIAFTQAARQVPNHYLWGGTLGPHYDCSGLIQRAFASVGIWLPRDSYQQQAFVEPLSREELQRGDLIFFGTERVNHVALYLGDGLYIHSSGREMGRNGIGIDSLTDIDDPISRAYAVKLWSYGRVIASFVRTVGESV
jgi:cell wall-associated NlpC family hydrolase